MPSTFSWAIGALTSTSDQPAMTAGHRTQRNRLPGKFEARPIGKQSCTSRVRPDTRRELRQTVRLRGCFWAVRSACKCLACCALKWPRTDARHNSDALSILTRAALARRSLRLCWFPTGRSVRSSSCKFANFWLRTDARPNSRAFNSVFNCSVVNAMRPRDRFWFGNGRNGATSGQWAEAGIGNSTQSSSEESCVHDCERR